MIKVITKEEIEKDYVKVYNSNTLMQEFNCETTRIQAYNLSDSHISKVLYTIEIYDKVTKTTSCSYYKTIKEMFTFWDMIFRHLQA